MKNTHLVSVAVLGFLALSIATSALHAQTLTGYYYVTISTPGFSGVDGGLAFDLISGDDVTLNNTAVISDLAFGSSANGYSIGVGSSAGSSSGDLLTGNLTLRDTGFTEAFYDATFNEVGLAFKLTMTNNFARNNDFALAPDKFAFYLTNPSNTDTLIKTSDPTGANALFTFDATGRGKLPAFHSYTPNITWVTYSVPEPSAVAFSATGLLIGSIFMLSKRMRKKRA